jgi:signal transduction histidine kinase
MDILTSANYNPMVLLLAWLAVAALATVGLFAVVMYRRETLALKNQQRRLQVSLQAERERLESVVDQRTIQLRELTHHLLTAREDERNRLARNLHDDLGALLTSAKLDAARIKSRLSGKEPESLELLAHLVETLNSGIALGRDIIEDLRPSALGNLGLVAALEILVREFAQNSSVKVECSLDAVKLTASAELTVYRLVQEAITNISRYAQASQVLLRLTTGDDQVEVSVRDDGVGFDAATLPRSAYGLRGMRFRVEAEGGTMNLVSAPGQGTLVQAKLPKPSLVVA